jgi:hypothetical protein
MINPVPKEKKKRQIQRGIFENMFKKWMGEILYKY